MSARIIATIEEKSTIDFKCDMTDENGDAVVPTAFKWHLTDRSGTVVNNRLNVPETPASSVTVTLAGLDLAILDATKDFEYRVFTVETDRGSADEPMTKEVMFIVTNLTKIS